MGLREAWRQNFAEVYPEVKRESVRGRLELVPGQSKAKPPIVVMQFCYFMLEVPGRIENSRFHFIAWHILGKALC